MKKTAIVFIAILFVTFCFAQQPVLWGMTNGGGTGGSQLMNGNGTVFNILGNGSRFNVDYNFPSGIPGAAPVGVQLCKATSTTGLLYGMTSQGGVYNYGIIFSYDPTTGNYADVLDFFNDQGSAPGANPTGSLIQGNDGLLYGMTQNGGTQEFNEGVIFSFDPGSGTYTDLYEFTGGNTGSTPTGSLMQASNGLLYGLTSLGGNGNQGDLFSFDPNSSTFTELSDLASVNSNLGNPQGTLVQASNSILYGTTYGANSSNGQLFSYNISTNKVIVLVSFTGATGSFPGAHPLGTLTIGTNGLLYGETTTGGANSYGVLFSYKISPATYTKLYDFAVAPPCGNGLMQASSGLFYGYRSDGQGSVFSFNATTSAYVNVYTFSGNNGQTPGGILYQASNGLLYGAATTGGSYNEGTFFSLSTAGAFNLILTFQTPPQSGYTPWGSLLKAKNGRIYGLCAQGGIYNKGTLFTIDAVTNNVSIYSFNDTDGATPLGSLIQASNGLLYGMTDWGGASGNGEIFSLDPSNPNNQPVVLYSFTSAAPDYCANPQGSLMQASNGLLYGMTVNGGPTYFGNIFSFDPANPANPPVNLYDSPDGYPYGDLVQASNGLLYGMMTWGGVDNAGSIFSFNPATNTYNGLYDFTTVAPDYGYNPYGDLMQAKNGLLYGMTEYGGDGGIGNMFSFDPAQPSNPPVNLVNFGDPGYSGYYPGGTLMQASDGNLYGMNYGGGMDFDGTLFQYNYNTGIYNDIHDFDYTHGAYPQQGAFIEIGVTGADTFLGYTNEWLTPSNWSTNTVPDSTTDVVIPSSPVGGNFPQITFQGFTHDIMLQDGDTLDLGRDGLLSVYGFWMGGTTITSTVTGPGGIVQFVDTSAQQIGGITAFQTVVLNNGGTTPGGDAVVNIYNQLILQAGQVYTLGNQNTFALKATSASSYAMLQVTGGSFFGPITDECYYNQPTTSNSFSQHMMGSPVDALSLAQFGALNEPDAHIVDSDCDETQTDSNSPQGTVYTYDETAGGTCSIEGWEIQSSNDYTTDGQGYSVVLNGSGVLSVNGWPNENGSYTVNGTNSNWSDTTLQGRRYNSGWVLLSNPYPAPLQFSDQTIEQNIAAGWDAQIQVWNTTGANAGSYQPATFLAPFQGFMVHVSYPGSATFTMNSGDQVYNANPTFYKQADTEQLSITATNAATTLTDVTTVGFNTAATSNFDPAYDMDKIPGALDRHTIYTTVGIRWLGTNILNSIDSTGSVPMGFEPGVSGNYTLSFGGVNSFDATSYLTLQDNQLNTTYNIRNGNYPFTSNSADNWNRFVLLFTPAAVISATNATCANAGLLNITQPGPANWTYTLADANNTTLSTGALNSSTPININLVAGVYTLTLVDGNNYTVVKAIQIGGDLDALAAFDSVATAQVNQTVRFTSTSQNAAVNTWNFGDGTTGTGNTVNHTYTVAGTYTVTLTTTSDSGCSSVVSHNITITDVATGIQNLSGNDVKIWSNENVVNVSFGAVQAGTTIKIYNELGQQLVSDQLITGTLYTKAINNIETGYVIVMVNNGQGITTGKVFISNNNK